MFGEVSVRVVTHAMRVVTSVLLVYIGRMAAFLFAFVLSCSNSGSKLIREISCGCALSTIIAFRKGQMIGCLRTMRVLRPLLITRNLAMMSRASGSSGSKPGALNAATQAPDVVSKVEEQSTKPQRTPRSGPTKVEGTAPAVLKTNIGSRLGQFTSPLYKKDSKGKPEKVPFGMFGLNPQEELGDQMN